jgi:hypothetical protein
MIQISDELVDAAVKRQLRLAIDPAVDPRVAVMAFGELFRAYHHSKELAIREAEASRPPVVAFVVTDEEMQRGLAAALSLAGGESREAGQDRQESADTARQAVGMSLAYHEEH